MSLAPPPKEALGEVSGSLYGYEEYLRQRGNGSNCLRTENVAQPRALRRGDILGNGDRVLATPREGYNGDVWILLSGDFRGHWVPMAERLPIALLSLTKTDAVPDTLIKDMQD